MNQRNVTGMQGRLMSSLRPEILSRLFHPDSDACWRTQQHTKQGAEFTQESIMRKGRGEQVKILA